MHLGVGVSLGGMSRFLGSDVTAVFNNMVPHTAIFNNMVQLIAHFILNAQLIYNALLAHSVHLAHFK